MARVQHNCTGCVPIDASIIEVYTQLISTESRAEEAAERAEYAAEHAIGKSPYIGENGDWWEWNDEQAAFIDTGVQAQGQVAVDIEMSTTSTNPVQNRVVTAAVNEKYTKPATGIPATDIADGVIPDVSQFITASVNNLVNYYLKSETYNKTEVDALISAVSQFSYEVVATLPTASASTMYKIYLVPSARPETQNVKDEYITIRSGSEGSYTYAWEQIGSTAIDLSGYVTTQQLNTALSAYTTTANLTTLLAAKQDVISDLATIRSGAATGATAYQKPSGGIPKSDLSSGVQGSLDLADSAIQARPQGEITPVITPADYATREELGELEAKVTDLEGQLGDTPYKDVSINYNWTRGLINSDGSVSDYPSSSYRYSALIPVTAGASIKIRVYSGGNTSKAFVFYAQDESAVDTSETGYQKQVTSVITVTVPNTAYYIRLQTDVTQLTEALAGLYLDPYLPNKSTIDKFGENGGVLKWNDKGILTEDDKQILENEDLLLGGEIQTVKEEVQLLEPNLLDGAIVAYTYWQTGGVNNHYVFPISGGDKIEATGTGSLYVCFLKTYTTPVAGATPDYCTGFGGRQVYPYPASVNAPADCRYIIINQPNSIGLSTLKISGVNVLGGVHRSISEIGGKIDGVLKGTDLTIQTVSNNIADPSGIIDGKLIDNHGDIVNSANWSIYRLPVTPGDVITVGGFYLGRTGYYAFYNDTTLVSFQQFADPNGRENPKTLTVPASANLFYFDIKSADSPSDPYELLQINRGDELLPYDEYHEAVTKILGEDLISNGTPGTIPDIIADLPLSADGSGIATGYAYINSSTGAVVVKL